MGCVSTPLPESSSTIHAKKTPGERPTTSAPPTAVRVSPTRKPSLRIAAPAENSESATISSPVGPRFSVTPFSVATSAFRCSSCPSTQFWVGVVEGEGGARPPYTLIPDGDLPDCIMLTVATAREWSRTPSSSSSAATGASARPPCPHVSSN